MEQAARENPTVLPFKLAYGIICAAVGQADAAREILREGMESGFAELAVDNFWMTSVIAYVIIAIELDDRDAAAQLLPVIEPYAAEISFNGVTSQGPVGAYAGKLASLLGRHDEAESHLRAALATATAFGWTYHRATTLFALAQARHRRLGAPRRGGAVLALRGVRALPGLRLPELDRPDRRPGRQPAAHRRHGPDRRLTLRR